MRRRSTLIQTILIHGAAGGVGTFAVQLAVWKKAKVIATAFQDDVPYLKNLSVSEVIDVNSEKFETKVKSVDAVIDLIGGDTLKRTYQVVKPGGVVATTAGSLDKTQLEEKKIRGVQFIMQRNSEDLAEVAKLVEQKVLQVKIKEVLPLEEANKAQDLLEKGYAQGKIILEVAP